MSVAPEVVHRSEARALARVPEDKDGQGGTYTARSVLVRSPGTSSVLRSTQSSPHAASRVYCRLSAEPAGSFMYAAALARPNRRSLAGEGTIGTACLACVHRPDGGGGGGDAVGRSSLLMPTATWRVASRTKERRTNEGERLRWYAVTASTQTATTKTTTRTTTTPSMATANGNNHNHSSASHDARSCKKHQACGHRNERRHEA